jgi:uncharacterized protein YlxW (UPF0749 family)
MNLAATTVLEAAPHVGGLASAWSLDGVVWDRHYHVTLLSDSHLRGLLAELDLEQEMEWVETRTGYIPVRGPGVRFEVASSPSATDTTEIRDEDLATLVDGLWEAGAEAISINGERLTVLTGIRNTGRAIHIGGVPIRAPYTVLAIGDPSSLQARLLETSEGAAWFVLVRSLGFQFVPENADDLRLPAADLRVTRYVESKLPAPNGVNTKEARP